MSNYHVTDEGEVRRCTARVNPCKYSSREDNRHFTSKEDAHNKADTMMNKAYSPLNSVKRAKRTIKNYNGFSIDISDISLNANNLPHPGALPTGASYEDFERVLEQIAGETDWYYEKV